MITRENFTEKRIRELLKQSGRDSVLLERAVYAFGLLEALAKVELPFVFKGGTFLSCITVPRFRYEGSRLLTRTEVCEFCPAAGVFWA